LTGSGRQAYILPVGRNRRSEGDEMTYDLNRERYAQETALFEDETEEDYLALQGETPTEEEARLWAEIDERVEAMTPELS
jgi:hypothetical protein